MISPTHQRRTSEIGPPGLRLAKGLKAAPHAPPFQKVLITRKYLTPHSFALIGRAVDQTRTAQVVIRPSLQGILGSRVGLHSKGVPIVQVGGGAVDTRRANIAQPVASESHHLLRAQPRSARIGLELHTLQIVSVRVSPALSDLPTFLEFGDPRLNLPPPLGILKLLSLVRTSNVVLVFPVTLKEEIGFWS